MNGLLLVILLQLSGAPISLDNGALTTPHRAALSMPKKASANDKPKFNLGSSRISTTPQLNPETEIHAQMEYDIGGQRQAIYDIGSKVSGLEEKREKHDRPDIDDLQKTKDQWTFRFGVIASIVGTASTLLIGLCGFLYSKRRWWTRLYVSWTREQLNRLAQEIRKARTRTMPTVS
jgi:hypothetical protein